MVFCTHIIINASFPIMTRVTTCWGTVDCRRKRFLLWKSNSERSLQSKQLCSAFRSGFSESMIFWVNIWKTSRCLTLLEGARTVLVYDWGSGRASNGGLNICNKARPSSDFRMPRLNPSWAILARVKSKKHYIFNHGNIIKPIALEQAWKIIESCKCEIKECSKNHLK